MKCASVHFFIRKNSARSKFRKNGLLGSLRMSSGNNCKSLHVTSHTRGRFTIKAFSINISSTSYI